MLSYSFQHIKTTSTPKPLWQRLGQLALLPKLFIPWRGHRRTCASTAWEVGPSSFIAVIFWKWTVSMDEALEVTGSIGLWIHLGLLTINKTCRHLSKHKGPSKNSHLWGAWRWRGHFPVFGGSILGFARQWSLNVSQVWLLSPCMQMQLPLIKVLLALPTYWILDLPVNCSICVVCHIIGFSTFRYFLGILWDRETITFSPGLQKTTEVSSKTLHEV